MSALHAAVNLSRLAVYHVLRVPRLARKRWQRARADLRAWAREICSEEFDLDADDLRPAAPSCRCRMCRHGERL